MANRNFRFQISNFKLCKTAIICACILLTSNLAAYERIVSLIPSVTRSLYLLKLQDKVIGVTVYCMPEAAGKKKIGNVLNPDIEKIVSLSPDLVIASKEGNRQETVEKLRELGLVVYVMEPADNFDGICADFLKLGEFLGVKDRALKVVADSRKRLASLRKKWVFSSFRHDVFWEIGAQPLFTAGKRSFINDYIEFAGAKNIFGDIDQRFPQVSREEVIKRNPSAIVIVTMGDVTAKEKESWLKYNGLTAVKKGNIHIVGVEPFTEPTPPAVAESAEKLYRILYENH